MSADKDKISDTAQKYALRGQTQKAVNEYLKLIEKNPQDKRSHLKLGDLYLKNGEEEKAIRVFQKVAALYEEEDLNFRAIALFKKILTIDPNFIKGYQESAKLYIKEGLLGNAKNCYLSILEIDPKNADARKSIKEIGGPQRPKGVEPPKKEEPAKKASPPQETRPIQETKPIKESSEDLSLKSEPFYANNTPSPEKSEPFYANNAPPPEKSEPFYANNAPPPEKKRSVESSLFSSLFEALQKPQETEVTVVDKDAETHYHLGIAYMEMELYDLAIAEFESASSINSISFDCHTMLGNCYMEKGDYNQSIEYYKKALEIRGLSNDKSSRLYFNLGLAYEANGMISEAFDTFQHVLKMDPSFEEVKEKIKKIQPLRK